MKKAVFILLIIIGNSLLYVSCDDCSGESTPDYYYFISGLEADHYNPNNSDTLSFSSYGLRILPEVETRYSDNSYDWGYNFGALYACDPYVGRFYGYDPAITKIAVLTDFDLNNEYRAGDTISEILYRDLYGSRQYLTDVNPYEISENFFAEPFALSENPIDSVAQRFTVVLRLSNGTDLISTTSEVYIQ